MPGLRPGSVVAERHSEPVGYITCHLSEYGAGSIGLIAVGEAVWGAGAGRDLVNASLEWFARENAACVRVVTQARNAAALRLYSACHFRTRTTSLWYHYWRPYLVMSDFRIPFNKPCLTGNELLYIADCLLQGHIAADGCFTRKCRQLLEKEGGAAAILPVTSCTHALEMVALLLDVQPGDEVIIPAFTFVSTANAFVLRGAKPVFIDAVPIR